MSRQVDMHSRNLLLWLFVFVVALPCLGASEPARHNIILITLDTTRADRMGFLGSARNLTPALDRFARESVVFTRAYSQVPLTTSSHATILTGTYPQYHNVNQPGSALAESLPYAPEILRGAGYRTAAFIGSLILQAKSGGAPGFDRAFGEYNANFHKRQPGDNRDSSIERRAEEVTGSALRWIRANSDAPFFLWIHIYDPHFPYDPPEPFASRFQANLYDGEIAYVDSVLGGFFAELKARQLFTGSLIAVMADHGEALGEHGERGHGLLLYDDTIHVPLLMKLPGQEASGKRVNARVELVDVLPTILDVIGILVPAAVQGRSLVPLIRNPSAGNEKDRTAYAETDYPHDAFGWSPLRSLRSGKYLFVQAPRKELYDQSSDPDESHNLAPSAPAVTSTLAAQVSAFRERTRNSAAAAEVKLGKKEEEELRSLGYVPSSGTVTQEKVEGTDPKDKVELANEISEAGFQVEEGQNQKAIRTLQAVLAKDPKLLPAYEALTEAWSREGNPDEVIVTLRKGLGEFPRWSMGHLQLAMVLIEVRNLKAAEPELRTAADALPQMAQVRYELARLYFNTGRLADAEREALRARDVDPRHYEVNLMLGAIHLAQGDPALAVLYFQAASAIRPDAAKPHDYLARCYSKLGDETKAEQERGFAAKLTPNEN
jgi:arylsulfatase A-like enzyme/Tfp pilus assembly protein PilF